MKERRLQEQWDIVGWWIYQSYQFALAADPRKEDWADSFSLSLSRNSFDHTHVGEEGASWEWWHLRNSKKKLTQFQKKLTQFQGGNMKREEDAENLWMNDFWNRMDTVQKVWKKTIVNCVHKRPESDEDERGRIFLIEAWYIFSPSIFDFKTTKTVGPIVREHWSGVQHLWFILLHGSCYSSIQNFLKYFCIDFCFNISTDNWLKVKTWSFIFCGLSLTNYMLKSDIKPSVWPLVCQNCSTSLTLDVWSTLLSL